MQIITLNPVDFEAFARNHEYKSYYQTVSYGNVMKAIGFNVHYIGIKDNDELIGASLIVYKEIYMGKKIAYAPRGILFDYTDKEKTIELGRKIKRLFKRQGFMLFRMDPFIPATIRDKNGKTIDINKDINNIMINIKSAGFIFEKKRLYFEKEHPRFEAIKVIDKDTGTIFRKLDKNIKHKLRRASGCGITVVVDSNKNVNELYEFVKDKGIYSKKYLEEIVKNFNNSKLYYALLNTDSFVIEAKKRFEREEEINNNYAKRIQSMKLGKDSTKKTKILNKKMDSDRLLDVYKADLVLATDLLRDHPKGLLIAGCLTVEYEGTSYMIADGYNKNLGHLDANYLIKWFIIDDLQNRGIKYFNMNAISGNFTKKNPYKHLNEAKLGFNVVPREYIGEFNLILDRFHYALYKTFDKDKNYQVKNDLKKETEGKNGKRK